AGWLMRMEVSSEYVSLCQAQLALLQTLGASLGAVYLAEEQQSGAARLVRVAALPDAETVNRVEQRWLPTPTDETASETDADRPTTDRSAPLTSQQTALQTTLSQVHPPTSAPSLNGVSVSEATPTVLSMPGTHKATIDEAIAGAILPSLPSSQIPPVGFLSPPPHSPKRYQQVVPLVHETLVLGILVTERRDRDWLASEHPQLEKIAETLTLACVLDQRATWLQQQQQQQPLLQQQQQDRFDNLLHQFRNPLTALRTFGKLLMKRMVETDTNRDIASSIVRESDRLQDLLKQFEAAIDQGMTGAIAPIPTHPAPPYAVEVVLETGMAEPSPSLLPTSPLGGEPLDCHACDLLEILQPLLLSATAIAQEKQLQLQVFLPKAPVQVTVAPKALREVLSNIVDNAIKYTPAGIVQVQLKTENQHPVDPVILDLAPDQATHPTTTLSATVQIWITDSGLGIPPEDLPRLFERHYRGIQATTGIPGTGLGLAIARALLLQMQGDIEIFSPPPAEGWIGDDVPSQGTTVVISLMAGA
ncbi:MAG: HAMP domain-containing sensor histidine kinase, partial [Synechococcales bacterium]|nr:HAMP domain-containing sensor histidine kinase [Synechococcales bacterium]